MNKFFKSSILMAFVTAISTSTLITSCQNDDIEEYTQNQEDKVLVNFC
jgi:Na+-translocating ferredoxin:NAD+ oxidoreductase RnfG subunit